MSGYRELYSKCRLCPRECGVDRNAGDSGFCGESGRMRLAWAGLHRGEEPPVTGKAGSGILFFTGCTLRCAFCQNRQLSRGRAGSEISPPELAGIMLELETAGADNINIVTGTQFIPGIMEALDEARDRGLKLQVVWNSSAYERREIMEMIAPRISLWLPDLKTLDSFLSEQLFHAPDYPKSASECIEFMAGTGAGVIMRHLVLPGYIDSTRRVLEWYSGLSGFMKAERSYTDRHHADMLLSLMTQYTPVRGADPSAPVRGLTREEAEEVYSILEEFSIVDGFFQGPPDDEPDDSPGWEPDFDHENPFPGGWARKVWHWKDR